MAMYKYAIALREEKTGKICGTIRVGTVDLEVKYKSVLPGKAGRCFLVLADAMHDTWQSYPLEGDLSAGVVVTPEAGKRADVLYLVYAGDASAEFLGYGKNCSQQVNMRKVRESIVRKLAIPKHMSEPQKPASSNQSEPVMEAEPVPKEQATAEAAPSEKATPQPVKEQPTAMAVPEAPSLVELEQDYVRDSQAFQQAIRQWQPEQEERCTCYDAISIRGEVEKCQKHGCEFVQPFGDKWSGSWWKIRYPDNSWHYIVGRMMMDGEEIYALGVPGIEGEQLPPCLEEFDTYMPAENMDVPGYWILFQKGQKKNS